jgi:hypothetical protein
MAAHASGIRARRHSRQKVTAGISVWDPAGFLGSTLWLIWLIVVGTRFASGKNFGKTTISDPET